MADISEKITEKKASEKKAETADMEQVEKIVSKMKQKYAQAGLEFEESKGNLGELRNIITSEEQQKIEVQTIEELQEFKQPAIRALGQFYLTLQDALKPVMAFIMRLPQVKKLGYWLYSANMRYSTQQYLAITTSATIITFIAALAVSLIVLFFFKFQLGYYLGMSFGVAIIVGLFATIVCLVYPRSIAIKRGNRISGELPFALRHMATELKSGIGLYRTMQAVAVSDYGVLSEEFAKTITEVEEGTETKEALQHMGERVQSKPLKNAITHIVRTIKTGGNLSEIMNTIAKEVSFETREQIREFAELMNFFGVMFIFAGIVLPTAVFILGTIKNAPLQLPINLPLDVTTITIFYLIIMPMVLGYFVFYIKSAQPKMG